MSGFSANRPREIEERNVRLTHARMKIFSLDRVRGRKRFVHKGIYERIGDGKLEGS